MKILKVQLCNLNSLRGEWTIDFTSGPLAQNGLYAITGPTGAGKTTLLDAITVALYNRVPRHGDKVHEMMSRHTAECYSEVTFEVNGNTYRSKWSLRRARGRADGNFQSDKIELADAATGTLLSTHRKTETLEKIQSLTGLDYDQFLRSVLLAQGQFARFLQAKDKERSELLEQMTDTHIFSEISAFVFQKTKDEKTALDTLQAHLGQIELLDEAGIAALQTEISGHNTQLDALRTATAAQQEILAWWKEEKILATTADDLANKQQLLDAAAAEAAPLLHKLATYRRAQPVAPAYDKWQSTQKGLENLHTTLELLATELDTCGAQKESADNELTSAKAVFSEATGAYEAQKPLLTQVSRLDDTIAQQQQSISSVTTALHQATIAAGDAANAVQKSSQKKDELTKKLSAVTEWLQSHAADASLPGQEAALLQQLTQYSSLVQQHRSLSQLLQKMADEKNLFETNSHTLQDNITASQEKAGALEIEIKSASADIKQLLQGRNATEIAGLQRTLPGTIANLQQLETLSIEWNNLKKRHGKGTEMCLQSLEKLNLLENEHTALLAQINEAENHLDTLQLLLEKERALQQYAAERMALTDDEPCPLCGATHHPFAHTPPPNELVAITGQISRQKETLDGLKSNSREKEKLVNAEKLNHDKYVQGLQIIETNLADKENQFNQLLSAAGATYSIDQTEALTMALQNAKMLLQTMEQLWNAYETALQQLRTAQNALQDQEQELRLSRERMADNRTALDKLLISIKDVTSEKDRLQQDIDTASAPLEEILHDLNITWHPDNIGDIQRQISQRAKQYAEQLQAQAALLQEENLLNQRHGHLEAEANRLQEEANAQQDKLNALNQALQEIQAERVTLLGTQSVNEVELALQNAINNTNKQLQQAETSFQQLDKALVALQTKQDSLRTQQEQLNTQADAYWQALQRQLAEAGFAQLEDLLAALIPAEEAANLQARETALKQQQIALQTLRDQWQEQKELHANQPQPATSQEAAEVTLQELQAGIDNLQQTIGALGQQLQNDARNRQRHAAQWERIQLQQQVATRWEQLNTIIGSKEGDKFSRFAQGLTLMYLLQLANGYLHRFNSRYELVKTEGDNLELEICDTWQADMVRPIASLSGGETFLVSLALALGLSALASSKVQIKSLFIDEGFGTLDSETLETALDALENLQAEGNSIGVISHVQAMQERISTQIRVIPVAGGYSRVEVVG